MGGDDMKHSLFDSDEDRRRDYNNLFNAMEQWREKHPEASDEDCFTACCTHKPRTMKDDRTH